MIAVAELNQTIPFQLDEDPPKVVGRCVVIPPDRRGPHAVKIFSDDILAVELLKRGEFACADCVERLLFPHPSGRDPEKNNKKPQKTERAPREPQVHKGEDLK